jgi:hypothetical protein
MCSIEVPLGYIPTKASGYLAYETDEVCYRGAAEVNEYVVRALGHVYFSSVSSQ